MKFNDVNKNDDEFKKVKLKHSEKPKNQINIIDSMHRYGNIGVYIMKNGKKGLFRDIATYLNDGKKPTSWALKISYTNSWKIQFGINPNVDFDKSDIYLNDLLAIFEKKYENINVSGHKKAVLISDIDDKKQAEEIANYIINTFYDVELDFISKDFDENFNYHESIKPLKITGFFPSNNEVDNNSIDKFNEIARRLSSIRLSSNDVKKLNIIQKRLKNNNLRDKDKNVLNKLVKDYLTAHDRISIAVKYLNRENK